MFLSINQGLQMFSSRESRTQMSNVNSQMLLILFSVSSFPSMWPHDTFEIHITLPVHYMQNEGFIPSLTIFYLVISVLLVEVDGNEY